MNALAFDPLAYVADMRAVGAVLTPFVSTSGYSAGARLFAITGEAGMGVPGAILNVGAKWAGMTATHPDWMGAVHDALKTEERT